MISNDQLKEFGFENIHKFPKVLKDHAVTVSLPSAMANQVEPVSVNIDWGLAIPVQSPGLPNGMVIRSNGTMVHVSHHIPEDLSSPLDVRFTEEIAYDVRIEAFNVMRRAVDLDPELNEVWTLIQAHWMHRYPPFIKEIDRQRAGEFFNIKGAVKVLGGLIDKFITDVEGSSKRPGKAPFKIIIQAALEMSKGWQGEEYVVDEKTVEQVNAMRLEKYLSDVLHPKLKKALKSPVFYSRSSFEIYYEPRAITVIKLVIFPPLDARSTDLVRGIDLD